ncbi:MAG TPA: SDR family oxidoreductase [Candidatus Nanoarchaeia archaeon]|nr:SDR family oxidoreductase [Candidatus Nanoarchaeia archaeon]
MSKVVFITGSSSGIGMETAKAFSKKGWNVIVTYLSSAKQGKSVKQECEKLGAQSVMLVQLDVTKDSSIKSAFNKIKKKYGKIDVLVNNAGIVIWKPFNKYTFKDIEKELRVNLEGTVKVTSVFLPIVKSTIANLASRLGLTVSHNCSVYAASKWGVRGFTKSVALENKDLFLFSVNPSMTATRMTDFEGVPASSVADLILEAVEGKRKLESGGDLNVWEILHQTPPK